MKRWALPLLLLAGGCRRPPPPPPAPPPAVYREPVVARAVEGLSLEIPETWALKPTRQGQLLKFGTGTFTGGVTAPLTDRPIEDAIELLGEDWTRREVVARETWRETGRMIDVLFQGPGNEDMRALIAALPHRGRTYTLLFLGKTFGFPEAEIRTALETVKRLDGPRSDPPFELPSGWSWEVLDPPQGATAGIAWAPAGFPSARLLKAPTIDVDAFVKAMELTDVDRSADEMTFTWQGLKGYARWTSTQALVFKARPADFDRAAFQRAARSLR